MQEILKTPLFSVITPVYNRAGVLRATVDCIRQQSFTDWELVIIDDGSIDGTQQVGQELSREDGRIRYFYQPNGGVSSARNRGVEEAKGKYLVFLDSDDQVDPGWLSMFRELLEGDKDIAFCAARFIYVNPPKEEIRKPRALGGLYNHLKGNFYAGTYAVKKEHFLAVGGFDPAISFGENYDLGVRLSYRVQRSGVTDLPLFIYHKTVRLDRDNLKKRVASKRAMIRKYASLPEISPRVFADFKSSTLLTMAVDLLRDRQKKEARKVLVELIRFRPFRIKPIVRLMLSYTSYYG